MKRKKKKKKKKKKKLLSCEIDCLVLRTAAAAYVGISRLCALCEEEKAGSEEH